MTHADVGAERVGGLEGFAAHGAVDSAGAHVDLDMLLDVLPDHVAVAAGGAVVGVVGPLVEHALDPTFKIRTQHA